MSGFITIERNLFDHEFFDDEPMSEREAWVWMIARAQWKDGRHKVGKDMYGAPRGTFMATLREMQSKFMWRSDTKVRNFLKRLESEGMIERTTVGSRNAPKTHVTICNYNEYQVSERTKNVPETHRERTKNAVKNKETREQGKRVTNVTQDARAADILAAIVPQQLASDFAEHRRDLKKPLTEKAAAAMVKKLDGHHDPGAVLTDSIANGWQGIFPEKTKPQLKTINGDRYERPDQHSQAKRRDPALEQMLRLSGAGGTPGAGGR